MELREQLTEVVKRIREANLRKDGDPIPKSDMIHRKLCADIESNKDRMQYLLRLLTESHHIFTLKLVEADERMKVAAVEGYVACEIQILAKLRERASRELESAYASQLYARKQAAQIVRELVPEARKYNNTPLGTTLNANVMLAQFEHFMATSYAEFSDTWKKEKLDQLLAEIEPPSAGPASAPGDLDNPAVMDMAPPPPGAEETPQRAVDHAEIDGIEEMDRSGKWGAAVDRYGVQFLLRIHFRKYEFDKVTFLVKSKRVAREEDLKYIRDTLKKMEGREKMDPPLAQHRDAMIELRRQVQSRLSRIFQLRQQQG